MENPFEKRATEHLRDDVAFLAVVAPEPVTRFLVPAAKAGYLFDRLVIIRGTPGSGKTTLARLFEYPSLETLLRLGNNPDFRDLRAVMEDCNTLGVEQPKILGCRLQLETDYREFWEFRYPEKLKLGLMASLLQARTVLAWLRHLKNAGVPDSKVTIIQRPGSEASIQAIGGTSAVSVAKRAREIEAALYQIVGSLVPPPMTTLAKIATEAYHPFDVIDRIRIELPDRSPLDLCPLAIFDDAHELHRDQYEGLFHWLARRELRISRWMLTRLDVLTPYQALEVAAADLVEENVYAGLTAGRDWVEIYLQAADSDRRGQRLSFRKMAKDMANRYLRRMPLFNERGLTNLSNLLSVETEPLSPKSVERIQSEINALQRKLKISDERATQIESEVDRYLNPRSNDSEQPTYADVRYKMVEILMHRYSKRLKGPALFPDDNPEPSRPLKADSSVFDAACLHLLHSSNRPYFYGIETLCDVGSANAELFLHLAGSLVERSSIQIIHFKNGVLAPSTQNHVLRERAQLIIEKWNFPWHLEVRKLVNGIAQRCLKKTLLDNASVCPNAYGVPQDEFDKIIETHPRLATILQFAVAYNGISINPKYRCKGEVWCLLELSGIGILLHGLTLTRGGFLEGNLTSLLKTIEETQ